MERSSSFGRIESDMMGGGGGGILEIKQTAWCVYLADEVGVHVVDDGCRYPGLGVSR